MPGGRAFLVEGEEENLQRGRENFALNGLNAHFTRAWVGARSGAGPDGFPAVCVDDFMATNQLARLAILHSDIQGAELDMLHGAARALEQRVVDYTFISTHTAELHAECDAHLKSRGYLLVASIPPAESYSVDGILVHRTPESPPLPDIVLSRKRVI